MDDHPLVRLGVREALAGELGFEVCGEAEDHAGALAVAALGRPHLAIVDLELRDSSGLDLLDDFHQRYPEMRALVFSMHDEPAYVEASRRAGAWGYVSKQSLMAELLRAVRAVCRGETYWGGLAAGAMGSPSDATGRRACAAPRGAGPPLARALRLRLPGCRLLPPPPRRRGPQGRRVIPGEGE